MELELEWVPYVGWGLGFGQTRRVLGKRKEGKCGIDVALTAVYRVGYDYDTRTCLCCISRDLGQKMRSDWNVESVTGDDLKGWRLESRAVGELTVVG